MRLESTYMKEILDLLCVYKLLKNYNEVLGKLFHHALSLNI